MPNYQVLSWEEIPSQIKVDDGFNEYVLELPQRFMEKIDAVAQESGKDSEDAYLDGWNWSEPVTAEGSLEEIAERVREELERKFPV